MTDLPKIELKHVNKRFEQIVALQDICLEIEDGQYTCLLGPTGSGKTSLLKAIAGLISIDRGEILIDGSLSNDVPPEKRKAVYMPQNYALFPHMTAWDNIAYGLRARGVEEGEVANAVRRMLETVKLKEWGNAYPHQLSGGMQQRVALARCIVTGAKILLLDEPLGALDARLRLELRGELKKLARELRLTVIHVTHDQAEATAIGDQIILLRRGRIEQIGQPEEIYLEPSSIFVASFVGEKNFVDGKVSDVRGKNGLIELSDGLQIMAPSNGLRKGELAIMAIRCESISPFRVQGAEVNNLAGVVRDMRFQGSYVKYLIELKGGRVVHSHVPSPIALQSPIEIDSTIPVSIRRDDIIVFKYPERGLSQEVEAF